MALPGGGPFDNFFKDFIKGAAQPSGHRPPVSVGPPNA